MAAPNRERRGAPASSGRPIHGLGGPVADLTSALGVPPAPEHVQTDGVHPTLEGQLAVARAVLGPLVAVSTEQRARIAAGQRNGR